jgi:hypothetical protein
MAAGAEVGQSEGVGPSVNAGADGAIVDMGVAEGLGAT